MTNKAYYKRQLKKINTKTEYPTKIKFFNETNENSTNFMDLNKDTAIVIVEWLQKYYINK